MIEITGLIITISLTDIFLYFGIITSHPYFQLRTDLQLIPNTIYILEGINYYNKLM